MSVIWATGTVLLAVVFGVSAVGKLRDRAAFAGSLRALRLLSPRMVQPVAWLVPLGEGVVGLALLASLTGTRWVGWSANAAAFALLGVFTLTIINVLARGVQVRCNCFGRQGTNMNPHHVVRNLCLMAVATVGFLGSGSETPPSEAVLALGMGIVAGVLVTAMDDIMDLARGTAS